MSTRKLIIASLICGLLILIAGTVKLLQTATGSEESPTLLAIGTAAEVGSVSATVRGVQVTNGQTLVDVVMRGVDVADASEGWSMLANGEITSPVAAAVCEQRASGAASDVSNEGDGLVCTLKFVAARGTPTIVYARDGEKRQWLGS